MTKHRWALSFLAVAFAAAGCIDNTSSTDRITVDHRTEIELEPGLDLSRIELVCEDGREMTVQSIADHIDLDGPEPTSSSSQGIRRARTPS